MPVCDRCGSEESIVYDFEYKDEEEYDELIKMKICWSCDFDIINGGDPREDAGDIMMERIETAHAYDPINNPPLSDYLNG